MKFVTATNLSFCRRMFGDIAFSLAMAGVRDEALFHLLVQGALFELSRIGHRTSCRPLDLYQMAERFACAGVVDQVARNSLPN